MQLPEIPKLYKEINQLILIPSLSTYRKLQLGLRKSGFLVNSAPTLADCFQPLLITNSSKNTILVGPFIGTEGILYILNLLNSEYLKEIIFIGSSCLYLYSNGDINFNDISCINLPSSFALSYECRDQIINNKESFKFVRITNDWSNIESNPARADVLATSLKLPTFHAPNLVNSAHHLFRAQLFDMESAFIADFCHKAGIIFNCCLLTTDFFSGDRSHPIQPKLLSKAAEINHLFDKIYLSL